MSAGTLTVHQLLNVLTDLDALALQVTTDTSTIYVDDLVSPAVRIVFEHDPAAPGFATSFTIEGSDGTPLYAASDYGVSLAAFQALVTAQDFEAALALLLVDLGTLALAEEADASLISLKDGLVIEGNNENTLFEVAHEATTVNAGDGDDVIVLRTTNRDGYFNGGEGNDTLWLDTSLGAVDVSLGDNTVMATVGFEPYFQRFESIEFFRGSIGSERFTGVGSGMRFEGGDGEDQFLLWSDSPTLVDVVTYADAGGDSGIVVNLGFDPLDLSAMDDLLEAALAAILAGSDAPWMEFVRDTFGKLDYISTGLLIEGSEWDDFFYGSAVEDGFVGGSGADHFFGGDGDDEFDGGADQDTFYLSGGFDDYAVTYDAGTDVFTIAADDGSGTDTVTGVEAFSFGGDVKTAAELKPAVVDSPPVAMNDDNDADAVIEAAGSDAGDASAQGDVIENDLDADSDAITVIGIRAGAEADAGSFLAVGATREIDGTYGTLTIALNGTWSYVLNNSKAATNTLPAGTTAYDVFTYQISAGGETDEATLTIAVGGRNDAPVATADNLSTDEDTPLTIDVSLLTGNDSDPEGDAITVIAVQGATNGTVALSAGKVTFTPTQDFHGTAEFSYTLQDALGAAVTQQVSVAVGSVNDAPQANSDTGLATNEDQLLTIAAATLLANDGDPDGDALTIASVSSDAGGAVVLNAHGTISFTPTADFSGEARFSYRVKDGTGALSASATATVAVTPVNDAPVANSDTGLATNEDQLLTIAPATLLANDGDPDGDALTIASVTSEVGGTAVLNVDGTISFTPTADFSGEARFSYRVKDGTGALSASATATVAVTPVNDAPVAGADSLSTNEDTSLTIDASLLTDNDIDPEADAIEVIAVQGATDGTVTLSAGTVTFTPTLDFHGTAGFSYTVRDAVGATVTQHVSVAVGSVNDAPVATADNLSTDEDTPLTIDASVLAGNDADPEGDAIAVIAVQGATNGTVALSAGKVTFTPAPGFHGTAGFSYTLQDALGAAVTQQVSVAVGSVNDTPQANSDTGLVTNEDQPLTIMAATLLANDSDPDGDALTIVSVSGAVGGTAVLSANGTITFTPTADFNGQARFSYRVKDGAGALSAPATATITVAPVNDAPSFVGVGPLATTVLENTTFVASLSALDIDSAALTFSLGGGDAGAFAIEGNTLRFAAPADFEAPTDSDGNGVYQVSVTVSDGALSETRNVAVFVLDGAGNTIAGTNAADRVDAGNGVGGKTATGEEDVVDGKGGKDTLSGAAGDDVLLGGKGDDRLNGDAGDDMLRGGAGRDRLDGGAGIDTADFSDATKAVVVTLNGAHQARARVGGAADDTLKNIENVTGGKRADTLTGDRAANVLVGNGGNDVLAGALGADTLSGGAGRDRFVFDTKLSALNVDTIGDFKHNGDRIVLDAGVFKAIGSSLSASEFRAGAGVVTAFDRDDRIIYDTQTGALYYDRDGSKAGVAIQFATLTGAPAIDAGDFLIV